MANRQVISVEDFSPQEIVTRINILQEFWRDGYALALTVDDRYLCLVDTDSMDILSRWPGIPVLVDHGEQGAKDK